FATHKNWLKKGSDSYNEDNYLYALDQYRINKKMSAEEFSSNPREVTSIPYKDVNQHLIDQAKQIPGLEDIAIAPSEPCVIKSGKEEVYKDRILKMLDISGPYLAQMKVNSWKEYGITPPEDILKSMVGRTNKDIEAYRRINTTIEKSNNIT